MNRMKTNINIKKELKKGNFIVFRTIK